MKQNKQILYSSINEIIQIEDTTKSEQTYAKEKFGYDINLVDLEARKSFIKGAITSKLKYCYKFNYYSSQNSNMN